MNKCIYFLYITFCGRIFKADICQLDPKGTPEKLKSSLFCEIYLFVNCDQVLLCTYHQVL